MAAVNMERDQWQLGRTKVFIKSPESVRIICDRIWEKGPLHAKRDFLPFFKLSPFQGLKSPRLLAWFISSLDLLLHRSNVRSLSKPPVPSGEPPKWGIKWRFLNVIDAHARPAHTGSGRDSRFAVGWLKNIHARFEVHSCFGSRDISVLKWKFGNSEKCSLFSDPVTYNGIILHGHWHDHRYTNINEAL